MMITCLPRPRPLPAPHWGARRSVGSHSPCVVCVGRQCVVFWWRGGTCCLVEWQPGGRTLGICLWAVGLGLFWHRGPRGCVLPRRAFERGNCLVSVVMKSVWV
jgi:hypothetical protein